MSSFAPRSEALLPKRNDPRTRSRAGPATTTAHAAARVRSLGRSVDRAPPGSSAVEIEKIHAAVQAHRDWIEPLRAAMGNAVFGRKHLFDRLLVALMTGGHVLVEGGAGLAKTLTMRTFAAASKLTCRSVRLTPDMLPADLVLPTEAASRGALFTHMILAEEIDQASPRVQHALLDAAHERRFAESQERLELPEPFLLIATQHSARRAGAHPLDEAQCDRFLLKVVLDYPSPAEERAILERGPASAHPPLAPLVDAQRLMDARAVATTIFVDDRIKDYLVTLVHATRDPDHYGLDLAPYLDHGVSSRATLDVLAASQAVAFLRGRAYVTAADVQAIWPDLVRHRLGLTCTAAAEGMRGLDVAQAILAGIPAP